jgi:hypothetical protein
MQEKITHPEITIVKAKGKVTAISRLMTTVVGIVIGYFFTIAEATKIVSVTSLRAERLDKIVSVTL